MSSKDHEDEPNTVMLKAPLLAGKPGKQAEALDSTGKLVCTDAGLLEDVTETEFWLTHREETLGRGEQCSVRILSGDLSRLHARVIAFSKQWVIEDCGSRNGVWINDKRIESRSKIESGDNIRLGRVPFRFEVLDVSPSELIESIPQPPPVKQAPSPAATTDDTIPLELSPSGELVDMDELEPEGVDAPVDGANTPTVKHNKAVAHASLVGVPVAPADQARLAEAQAAMRSALPEILETLTRSAREGDVAAAQACLDYLGVERVSLPGALDLSGTLSERVEQTLAAMAERVITPAQALDILRSLDTAAKLTASTKP